MRRSPARALLFSLALSACAPDGHSHQRGEQPSLATPEPAARTPAIPHPDSILSSDEEEATELDPPTPHLDAGSVRETPSAVAADARAPVVARDAGSEGSAPTVDAARDEPAGPPCQRGSRRLITLSVNARVTDTVQLDDRFIYFQSALSASEREPRHEIQALPRTALYGSESPPSPFTILRDDFAIDALVDGGDGYLFFIAMPQGDSDNQGLFRALKRERVGIESVPIHARSSDDYWPGQLAADQDAFYLASIGPDSHSLRLVRFARADNQREELWLNTYASNDGDALDALSLRGGDIALDAQHVYFTVRVNRGQAAPEFQVYRLNKQGRAQTPQLLTTIRSSDGGIASDGAHLFFSHDGQLEQYDLASGAREQLVAQEGMRDLSYTDGVLSWAASNRGAGTLAFFCL